MTDFSFSNLNDKEFEILVNDLLSKHLKTKIERFKQGKDGGIDGRFFITESKQGIIQSKHWLKSGLNALFNYIKKAEVQKVVALDPEKYIFVTSLQLSIQNKEKIKSIFSPYIKKDSDVYGNEDLNDLLNKYTCVLRKHYKLWLSNTVVLQTILNNAIYGRSKYLVEEILKESNKYVATSSHFIAIEKLEEIHTVIITGSPGVGKTTLANQLLLNYLSQDFEFFLIENSLNEAEQVFESEKKQIFYFDDFLGRNYLKALSPHQDSHIINFIKRIQNDKKKRFILTSRTNILNQGIRLSDLIESSKIEKKTHEVTIKELLDLDKAKILYNHIWFSNLKQEFKDEIYCDKRYKKIINHRNFNPRLISFITDIDHFSHLSKSGYWDFINKNLNNPSKVWGNVFDVQLDELSIKIIIAITLHGTSINEDDLRKFFLKLISKETLGVNKTFNKTIKVLVGALLNRTYYSDDIVWYDLFDPSIADYVIENYFENYKLVEFLFSILKTQRSISNLVSLYRSKVLSKKYFVNLIDSQISILTQDNHCFDEYELMLVVNRLNEVKPSQIVKNYLINLLNRFDDTFLENDSSNLIILVGHLLRLKILDPNDSILELCLSFWLNETNLNYDDFNTLTRIISFTHDIEGVQSNKLKTRFLEFLAEEITEYLVESDTLSFLHDECEFQIDSVESFIEKEFSNVNIECTDDDVIEIANSIDLEYIVNRNLDLLYEPDSYSSRKNINPFKKAEGYNSQIVADPIDDLFDRG